MNVISSNGTFVSRGGASNKHAIETGCWATLTGISGASALVHLFAGNGLSTIWYLALAILAGSCTHDNFKRCNPLSGSASKKTVEVSAVPA